MGKEILTYDDLLQIVELMKSAEHFSEFHLKIGDIELDLKQSPAGQVAAPSAAVGTPRSVSAIAPTEGAPAAYTAPEAAPREPDIPTGSVAIRSPMVGTFYRAPESGAAPFVAVGQPVNPDTTVCIIEVMKLMNSIQAGCKGTVTHVLVNDAEAVDAEQILIVIDLSR